MLLFQDDFVDKNRKEIPKRLRFLIQKSTGLSDIDSEPVRSLKTLASTLKFEVDNLIKNPKETVSDKFKIIDYGNISIIH